MATNLRRQNPADLPMPTAEVAAPDDAWKTCTPVLSSDKATIRGLLSEDAPSLFTLCTTEPVGRFIWPPPSSAARFQQFIDWTRDQQTTGRQICFAVVPAGENMAAGLFQIRQLEPNFISAEWGFVVGERYWGTGLFMDAARLVLDFLFTTVGVNRLEARTVVTNGRANGALKKLGAVQEGTLRKGFCTEGRRFDQYMWSILADDWRSPADVERFH
jgi:ribosomal-protein-alanine N-acetyltransferase